jgi:hypothetical protein
MGIVIYKDRTGRNSLKRVIAFLGFVFLSLAFGLMAWKGKITQQMFYTYPVGILLLYAPQLAITLLKIWKGQCVPADTPPAAADKKADFGGDV